MTPLVLREFHRCLGACFLELSGVEVVARYGDVTKEHAGLWNSAGVLDFSFRSRLCVTGRDRVRFLHGQVTNDIGSLQVGEGCYAALVTTKGKMQSDLNIYCLQDECLLDFEAGLTAAVSQRLEKYIVADDVQVVDVGSLYGLLSVQGPKAQDVVRRLDLFEAEPAESFRFCKREDTALGELYLMNQPRLGTKGFDVFVPTAGLGAVADKLLASAKAVGAVPCGWEAFDAARIEAGLPRFGVDMDENNFPQECSIESRAVSYTKGCYIGQEVLNRLHTMGHVNRELHGLRLADELPELPHREDKLFLNGQQVGYITSAAGSEALGAKIALGYVRKPANRIGVELTLRTAAGETRAQVVELPFRRA